MQRGLTISTAVRALKSESTSSELSSSGSEEFELEDSASSIDLSDMTATAHDNQEVTA